MARVTFTENETIAAGGSTTVSHHTKRWEPISLRVNGDSNSTNLDISFSQAAIDTESGTLAPIRNGTEATGIDASSDTILQIPDGEGVETVGITLTNNAASSTTVSVYGGEWNHS